MPEETNNLQNNAFVQKKVNHIFHYTKKIEILTSILEVGFIPSYCLEHINDLTYYIPMVSFCNIPLADVEKYMYYGTFGIGLSLDWAIRNHISPVVYIHENTPFADLHRKINLLHIMRIGGRHLKERMDRILDPSKPQEDFSDEQQLLKDINDITVPAIQFFKGWKTQFDGQEIITYLEREWRYIPELPVGDRLILVENFEKSREIENLPKPHFPDLALNNYELTDLRYIVIESNAQRKHIFDVLVARFGDGRVISAIVSGELSILTWEQVHNDF